MYITYITRIFLSISDWLKSTSVVIFNTPSYLLTFVHTSKSDKKTDTHLVKNKEFYLLKNEKKCKLTMIVILFFNKSVKFI